MKCTFTASIALALSFSSVALAQEEDFDAIEVYLLGNSPMLASIVAADPSTTTVALACPTELSKDECPLDPFTLTMGPTFLQAEASGSIEGGETSASISLSCSLEGKTSASCIQTMLMNGREDVSTMDDTYSSEDSAWGLIQVTAGMELITSAGGEATPTDGAAASTGAAASESEATAAPISSASRSQTGTPSPTESSANGAASTGAASSNNIVKSPGMAGLMGAVLAIFAL